MTHRLLLLSLSFAVACSAAREPSEKDSGDPDDTDLVDDTDVVVDTDDTDEPVRPVLRSFQIASPTVGGGVVSSDNFRAVVRIAPPVSITHTTGSVQARPPLPLLASETP